eukprot:153153_1
MNNKLKSSLLVFIFMNINITSTELIPTTMSCSWDGGWSNDYDGTFSSSKNDRFFSGIYSVHSNYREDRLYKFKRCKPILFSTVSSTNLEVTDWDAFWSRSCSGNSAITGISSWHSNYREDRRFQIYCGSLSSTDYTLDNCAWTSSYTSYDQI